MINYSNESFIGVIIQYRLGAFGFLNSPQMASAGGLNAGITDARAALEWVQTYINLFGGDPERVTVWGQSSGGGTILHLAAAQAEKGRKKLWQSAVLSSPYLTPMGACNSSFWAVSEWVTEENKGLYEAESFENSMLRLNTITFRWQPTARMTSSVCVTLQPTPSRRLATR